MTLLEYRAVRKSFGDKVVLDGIDLAIDRGAVISLIGASGSGKSTLLRCTNLLEPIDDGTIWFDGNDISEPGLPPDEPIRAAGIMPAPAMEQAGGLQPAE